MSPFDGWAGAVSPLLTVYWSRGRRGCCGTIPSLPPSFLTLSALDLVNQAWATLCGRPGLSCYGQSCGVFDVHLPHILLPCHHLGCRRLSGDVATFPLKTFHPHCDHWPVTPWTETLFPMSCAYTSAPAGFARLSCTYLKS